MSGEGGGVKKPDRHTPLTYFSSATPTAVPGAGRPTTPVAPLVLQILVSLTRHSLVLVVQKICGRGYDAGRTREGRARGEERPVGGPLSRSPVGVADVARASVMRAGNSVNSMNRGALFTIIA